MSAAASDVAERLRSILVERYGGSVELATPATSNATGFDSAIHYVRYRGSRLPEPWRGELVIRVKSRPDAIDDARFEAAVHTWVGARGYPAPAVLEVFEAGALAERPAQVIERAPGVMALDAAKRAPWTFGRTITRLAALQTTLHQLDPAGFPECIGVVDRRLTLPRRVADALDHQALQRALERVEPVVVRARDAPPAVCHGDFHPLNVIVDGDAAAVIDWSDAGVGDRHGDLARTLLLFELAAVAASSRTERAMLGFLGPRLRGRYERAYRQQLPVDDGRLALWMPIHLLHGWAQGIAAEADLFGDGGATADRLPPGLTEALEQRFESALDDVI